MVLRLVTAIARSRLFRRGALALLSLLVVATLGGPALAEDSNEAYSATVKVDATADNAAAARELARLDGQRRALAAVIERLSGSQDTAKPPKLEDKAITDMVDSFEVANERMSAVRYIADYTFHFRPSKIRRLVRVSDSASIENGSKKPADAGAKTMADSGAKASGVTANRPIVVLPVYNDGGNLMLWDDPNPWRAAWSERAAGPDPSRLALPLGDAKDLALVDAEKAQAGMVEPLSAISQRNGSPEALVALATAQRQGGNLVGLDVSLKRYRAGHLVDSQEKSFDATPGESEPDFLKRTAEAIASDLESGSKNDAAPSSTQQSSLTITVPLTSLGEWLRVRARLAAISSVRKVDLLSLSRQEARIEVKYIGTQDQLKASLSEASLDLGGGDPMWRLQPSSAPSTR